MVNRDFNKMLKYLNRYANAKWILTQGYPWNWEYSYENGNYYRTNRLSKEKQLTTKDDIADDFKKICDTEIYNTIMYRLK